MTQDVERAALKSYLGPTYALNQGIAHRGLVAHDTGRLTEAFRRAVLRLFVRLQRFDVDQAASMFTWPHSGFHVHTAVWVSEDDRAFATRLALLRAESRRPGAAHVCRSNLRSSRDESNLAVGA